ncbi:MAG: HAD family hydrolase [Syntrophales bacterium]|jgi:HAD superfamily hydrolase (TIGR01549 family)|nr:HAD family hydrolase [Syntrophales bacterium]
MDPRGSKNAIRAVLFDFDGTLTGPGSLDFNVMRKAVGCPQGRPVLEFINGMASQQKRTAALQALDAFEAEAARKSRPNDGAEEILEFLRTRGVKVGIISRNSLASIRTALENFQRIRMEDFSVILSRDDPFSPKPSPEGILAAARIMAVPVSRLLVVGDFVFDVEAGFKAGAITAFLTNRGSSHPCVHPSDFTLEHLGDLRDIVGLC